MADVIILNKADLVEPDFLSDLSQRLKKVNSLAPITATSRAQIALKNLLGLRGFELEQVEATLESAEKLAKHNHEHPGHVCSPECDHDHHDHHDHSHNHDHDHSSSGPADHDHEHTHAHAGHSHGEPGEHSHDQAACEPGCTNPDHDHSHHSHSHAKPLHNDKVGLRRCRGQPYTQPYIQRVFVSSELGVV